MRWSDERENQVDYSEIAMGGRSEAEIFEESQHSAILRQNLGRERA